MDNNLAEKTENGIFILSPEQLEKIVLNALKKHDSEKQQAEKNTTVYTFNQARKILKIGYDKLNKLIENGYLRTTADGKKIPQTEIDNFLSNEKTAPSETEAV